MNKSLDDKTFIAQTVNYANNEGVVWCVLTNGLVYRVYKTNEPVAMDKKLLFEADLREVADGPQVLRSLQMLTRNSIQAGTLDDWGDEVFAGMDRNRNAFSALADAPPQTFLNSVSDALDGPPLTGEHLKASLSRILKLSRSAPAPTRAKVANSAGQVRPAAASTDGYSVSAHTKNIPAGMIDLYERLDSLARSLSPAVECRAQKAYIGYYASKRSFFTLKIQKAKIRVWISLPPSRVKPWNQHPRCRDVSKIGHHGMGDVEFLAVFR